MPKPLTSAQVAAQLGISPRAVQALAKRRGIARVGRDWLFTPAQVASLATPLRSGPKPRKDK